MNGSGRAAIVMMVLLGIISEVRRLRSGGKSGGGG